MGVDSSFGCLNSQHVLSKSSGNTELVIHIMGGATTKPSLACDKRTLGQCIDIHEKYANGCKIEGFLVSASGKDECVSRGREDSMNPVEEILKTINHNRWDKDESLNNY